MWELHRGVLDAALEHARAATEVTAETPFPVLRAQSLVLLDDALRTCGELGEAEVALADRPADEHAGWGAAAAHAELAAIALERANHGLALREALSAGDLAEPIGVVNPAMAPWRSSAALAARAAGDTGLAARLAGEQLEHARAFGAPGTVGAALRVQALVLDDVELLAQAERVLSGSGARLEHAHALVDLGAALRRRGERARSREPLAAGLEIAHRCGARPLAERALTELRAAGARPRSIMRTGLDALTPSERRIAELAAAGHTNREIGGEAVYHQGDRRDPPAQHLPEARGALPRRARKPPAQGLDPRAPAARRVLNLRVGQRCEAAGRGSRSRDNLAAGSNQPHEHTD
jgi:hypothetical protein